jgi:UDP-N-acetylglucosamine 2-epimerase (non-hydrolysing)
VLKVPCVTVRGNTKRPETVEVGGNVVAGVDPEGTEGMTSFV